MRPGFYPDMSEAQYHADPCAVPSLSSSIAKTIIGDSLKHAWLAHPQLNPNIEQTEPTREMEIGTVVHALILRRTDGIMLIDADDYKKAAAKEARAQAYAAGVTPILESDRQEAARIAEAFKRQLTEIEGCEGFGGGTPELTGIVQDASGAWLRSRMDMFEDHGSHAAIWDVKTGKQSAAPIGLGKRIANMGYEVQAAFYERVVIQLRPELAGRLTFRWVFIENAKPHFIQVSELENTGLEIGRRKVAAAIGLWNRALQTGEWPAYPAKIVTAEYPVYAERQWMEREEFDEDIRSLPPDPILCRPVPHTPKPMLDVIAS